MKAKLGHAVMIAVLSVACEKSLSQQQREAQEAQRKADEETARSIDDTNRRIAQTRYEANEEMGQAARDMRTSQRNMNEKVDDLATSSNDTVRKAQEKAEGEQQDVANALRKAGDNLRRSVEIQLNDLDNRAVKAREVVVNQAGEARVKSERALADVTRKSQALRQDLKDFEVKTVQSIEAFSRQLNDRLNDLGKSIDGVESQN